MPNSSTILLKALYHYLYFLLVFAVYRCVYFFAYLHTPELEFGEILNSFWVGMQFDNKYLGLFMLVPLPTALVALFLNKNRAIRVYHIVQLSANHLFLLFSLLVFIIDFYFFQNFGKRIDFEYFRVFEDESDALLSSITSEYPVGKLAVLLVFTLIANHWISQQINKLPDWKPQTKSIQFALLALYIVCDVYAIRGSFDTFPLRRDDLYISQHKELNMNASNPLFSLKEASKNRKKYTLHISEEEIKARYGLDEQELNSLLSDSNLFATTPRDTFLEAHRPNVVFILMESLGTFLFKQHTAENNLLGTLGNVLDSCLVFENFISSTYGTIESLEYLQVGTNYRDIARTQYKETSFATSVARPFHKKGYRTAYITAGKLGWRNTGNFLRKQSYDACYGQNYILKQNPDAEQNGWGLHDQNIYSLFWEQLKESNQQQKPYFGFGLTITNHTPFSVPSSYRKLPVQVTPTILEHTYADEENLEKSLLTFQYANDCLGKFIQKILNSELAENTIIVATGDHNSRKVNNFDQTQFMEKVSVPLLLYIPPKYRKNKQVDVQRYGSHKDIFPTIYHAALSEASYHNTGFNLLTQSQLTPFFGAYANYFFNSKYAYEIGSGKAFSLTNRELTPTDSLPTGLKSQFTHYLRQLDLSLLRNILGKQ